MIKETREIYKCGHCRKVYQIERYCIEHEPKCPKNPLNKMKCLSCNNIEKRTMNHIKWVSCPYNGETEEDSKIQAFWCTSKEHWVYPRICTNPILQEDIEDEIENNPMPNKCNNYKFGSKSIV